MTVQEVMEYFKNPENRKEYIDTIQLSQDEEKAKKERENLEKKLSDEKYIEYRINTKGPKKFTFSNEIKDAQPEIISSIFYFIGKDGKVEQFEFSGDKLEREKKIIQELNAGKLLVYSNLDGDEKTFIRSIPTDKKISFNGGKELTVTFSAIQKEEVKEPERYLMDYGVAEEDRRRILESVNARERNEQLEKLQQLKNIDERINKYHASTIEIEQWKNETLLSEIKKGMQKYHIENVELNGNGRFTQEEMVTLALCAEVNDNVMQTWPEDGSTSYKKAIQDAKIPATKEELHQAALEDDSVKLIDNIYGNGEISPRMATKYLSILKGRMYLMDAVNSGRQENIAEIIKGGLAMYRWGKNVSGRFSHNFFSQNIILGRIGKFLEAHSEIAREMNMQPEQIKELKDYGIVAEEWIKIKENQTASLKEITAPDSPERQKQLLDYISAQMLFQFDTAFGVASDELLVGWQETTNEEERTYNLGMMEYRKVMYDKNMPESPIVQAVSKDGNLDKIKSAFEEYIKGTEQYQALCRMSDAKLKQTLGSFSHSLPDSPDGLSDEQRFCKELEKKADMDFVEKDEANNLIAKSMLARQYQKKIYDSNSSDQMCKLYIDDCRGEKLTFDRINQHIDLMWKSVDGASLWWKHSGDYAQMHKQLKEIRAYVKKQPKDKRIEGDDKFKKMLDDLKTASEVYKNNKESSKTLEEIKTSANGIARYNAAKGVALVVDSIWDIERKAEVTEQKRAQAEKQEQTENQKSVENTNPYNVDYILQQLKEQNAVPENVSREMLSLAVIVGVPVKKKNPSENDKQIYDERKLKMKDLLTAMANPDGVSLNQEQKDLLNQNIEKVQKVFREHVKVNKEKLHAYNNLMFEQGCEKYMSLGGRFLQGLGSGYFSGKDNGIPAASAILMREANIWDKTSSISAEMMPSGTYVLEDGVKMIVAAKLLKESHSEISKNPKSEGKNVIAMLQLKEGNTFVSDIYDQVKDILNLKYKNGYVKLDDFNAALENNREKIQQTVIAYSKAELHTARKQAANENVVHERAVEKTVQKKAEVPSMGKK